MRRTAVLHVLTGVALASAAVLACGGGGAPAHTLTSTSAGDAPPSTPVPIMEETPDIPSDPRISSKVVEAMLPSPAATSAAFGLPPSAWVLEAGLGGPWDPEGFRLVRPGITAGWIASFGTGLELDGLALELFFHDTPEDAERTYQFNRRFFGGMYGEDERETIADAFWMGTIGPATSSDVPVTSVFFRIRQGTVIAFGSMQPGENRDVSN